MRSFLAVVILLSSFPALAATAKKLDRKPVSVFRPLTVTLDVKDEDVRDVLKSLQRQCEIKNVAVDPDVQGKATFYFRDLPCATAFDVVLRTYGLKSATYSSSLIAVGRRP